MVKETIQENLKRENERTRKQLQEDFHALNARRRARVSLVFAGMIVAFAVSVAIIRFLMGFIRKHDFKVFGWYRIVLGALVIAYFALFARA